jgi:hypothetical protein
MRTYGSALDVATGSLHQSTLSGYSLNRKAKNSGVLALLMFALRLLL